MEFYLDPDGQQGSIEKGEFFFERVKKEQIFWKKRMLYLSMRVDYYKIEAVFFNFDLLFDRRNKIQ